MVRRKDDCEAGRRRNASARNVSLDDSSSQNGDNGKLSKNNSKMRKRKKKDFEKNICAAEVEQLVKIKQKQDEDKAAVRLHSYSATEKIHECNVVSTGKNERMKTLSSTASATKVKSSNTCEHVPVRYPEVVLCLEVYHNERTWMKSQEFLVLGQQTLTELRDKIYCSTDLIMRKAEQHDPSAYFLIEDVFCNDLREPSAIDYSGPIFHWLKNSKDEALKKWKYIISGDLQNKEKGLLDDLTTSTLPDFKAVDMHKTRFCDLQFRLGAGYLYCHQGDCKHMIVIRDMRLIHPEDVQNRAAYPIVTFHLKFLLRKCSICRIYGAKKVTVDDKWAKENPCYFCDNCYYLLHYSQDGSLLYNEFSVYDYHQDYL